MSRQNVILTAQGAAAYCETGTRQEVAGAAIVAETVVTGGSFAWTEGPDAFAFSGSDADGGSFAWTEDPDTFSFSGSDADTGTLAWTEGPDAFAFQGTNADNGSFSWTEDPDTFAFSGSNADTGTFAWTEDPDAFAFSGTDLADDGTLTIAESVDTFLFSGTVPPAFFPTLPGLGYPVIRRPNFRTIVASHPSGGEARTALWTNALWEFELTFDGLSNSATQFPGLGANSFKTLIGFYLSFAGQAASFLYVDPDFNALLGQTIGVGDGATQDFTLVRAFGSVLEPVSYVTGASAVYLDGVPQSSGWSVVTPNTLAFSSPPGAGVAVSADFTYGFLCRFLEDTEDFEQLMINLWDLKSIKFRQVRT